jgi:hypothetical protein
MNDIEYMADQMHRYHQTVVLPKAEHQAMLARELTILRQEHPAPSYRNRLLEALGGWMMNVGESLAAAAAPRQVSRPN